MEHILNTIRLGLSNARIEATNNKIKLHFPIESRMSNKWLNHKERWIFSPTGMHKES